MIQPNTSEFRVSSNLKEQMFFLVVFVISSPCPLMPFSPSTSQTLVQQFGLIGHFDLIACSYIVLYDSVSYNSNLIIVILLACDNTFSFMFCSSFCRYSLLTLVSEAICHLIYPFRWQVSFFKISFFVLLLLKHSSLFFFIGNVCNSTFLV